MPSVTQYTMHTGPLKFFGGRTIFLALLFLQLHFFEKIGTGLFFPFLYPCFHVHFVTEGTNDRHKASFGALLIL